MADEYAQQPPSNVLLASRNNLISSSSSSFRARDEVYCHEVAKRAVARAALHLGVDTMSVEAVDATAGVLLAYMDRIGRVLAAHVEAAGRSSAHVHVWDALRAVEVCTEPAVLAAVGTGNAAATAASGLSTMWPAGNSNSSSTNPQASSSSVSEKGPSPAEQMTWKGLAYFCFGSKWRILATKSSSSSAAVANQPRGRSGKGLGTDPQAATGESEDGNDDDDQDNEEDHNHHHDGTYTGWHAPFPDEVGPFPLALHRPGMALVAENALLREEHEKAGLPLPDDAFTKTGSGVAAKRKKQDAPTGQPAAKKTKTSMDAMDVDTPPATTTATSSADEEKYRPWHFPRHWPSFPRPQMGTRALVVTLDDGLLNGGTTSTAVTVGNDNAKTSDGTVAAMTATTSTTTRPPVAVSTADPTRSVRSALVQMGWGTTITTTTTSMASSSQGASAYENVQVRPGRSTLLPPVDSTPAAAPIVPLNKQSSYRVNRILEGSMD